MSKKIPSLCQSCGGSTAMYALFEIAARGRIREAINTDPNIKNHNPKKLSLNASKLPSLDVILTGCGIPKERGCCRILFLGGDPSFNNDGI